MSVEQRLEDALARIAALELGQARSGPLSAYEEWRPFFTGKVKYDGLGMQIITGTEEATGGTIAFLPHFVAGNVRERPPAEPGSLIYGFKSSQAVSLFGQSARDLSDTADLQARWSVVTTLAGSANRTATAFLEAQDDLNSHYAILQVFTDANAGESVIALTADSVTVNGVEIGADDGTRSVGTQITPAQLTGDVNDYNPTGFATAGLVRLSADGIRTITGFAAQADGRLIYLFNAGTQQIVLASENAGSAEANRIASPQETLAAKEGAILYYDGTLTRWGILAYNN